MQTGCTCAGRAHAGIIHLEPHADVAGGGVRHDQRDKERTDEGRTLFAFLLPVVQTFLLMLDGGDTPYPRSHDDTDVRVFVLQLQFGILYGLMGCRQGILAERIEAFYFFSVHAIVKGIKALHLCGDLAVVIRGVKFGNPAHAGSPFFQGTPELFFSASQRRHNAHAGNHDPSHIFLILLVH